MTDHKLYKDKAKDCTQWLSKAKDKFASNADTSGTRQELEERLEKIQVQYMVQNFKQFFHLEFFFLLLKMPMRSLTVFKDRYMAGLYNGHRIK